MNRARPDMRRTLAILALVAALLAFPVGALASHQFADVPDSNPFHADISALVNAGVTSGCGSGNYCPNANVTRGQMAAFLNRLGALAPGKAPVVNATKLDGLDSTAFALAGHDHAGAHTQVQWDVSVPASSALYGTIYVSGTTTIPAGSWLRAYAARVTVSDAPPGCVYFSMLLRMEPFNGYIYGWERFGASSPPPPNSLLVAESPQDFYVTTDSTLRLDVFCLDYGYGGYPGSPAITGGIILEWVHPPMAIL